MPSFADAADAAISQQEAAAGVTLTPLQRQRVVEDLFHAWLDGDRIDPLIEHLHARFPLTGGEEMARLLRMSLEEQRRPDAVHRLYAPLVRGAVRRFWREWPHAEAGRAGNIAAAAQAKAQALVLMEDWFQFAARQREAAMMERLLEDMRRLHANQRRPLPPRDERPMTDERFWDVIEHARHGPAGMAGFDERLEQALAAFGGEALVEFQRRLKAAAARLASHDLWALAYLARGGCSDDAFDYFRAWIVAQGRGAFEAALRGPAALVRAAPLAGDLQCEGLLYAAEEAYELREGKPMPPVRAPKATWTGRKWKEETLERTHPDLVALLRARSGPEP